MAKNLSKINGIVNRDNYRQENMHLTRPPRLKSAAQKAGQKSKKK
jgi:hypothetical protein